MCVFRSYAEGERSIVTPFAELGLEWPLMGGGGKRSAEGKYEVSVFNLTHSRHNQQESSSTSFTPSEDATATASHTHTLALLLL